MARKANISKLARQRMLKILRDGRVTVQTAGVEEKGSDGKVVPPAVTKTVRDPSTADLRLALEMAQLADAERDYKGADELRDQVKANQTRRAEKTLRIAGQMPPVGDGNDAAVRAG
jgi:hypothetical protein